MNRTYQCALIFTIFLITLTFSQSYKEDSLAVQAILDANGLSSLTVEEVSNKNVQNRIDSLALESKGLTTLPKEIGTLTALMKLYLKENQLTSLPDEIGNCTELIYIDLTNNSLSSIPSAIGDLNKLMFLYLQKNALSIVPDEIGDLPELLNLYLEDNNFTTLPDNIKNLSKIKKLKLSRNSFTSLPSTIGDLVSLMGLYCEDNKLESIPPEIGNLTNLDILWLHRNCLTSLPGELGQCSDLVAIDVSHNKLTNLPDGITSLTPSQDLDLGYNKLDTSKIADNIITWADQYDDEWKITQDVSEIIHLISGNAFSDFSLHYSPHSSTFQIQISNPVDIALGLYSVSGKLIQSLLNGFTLTGVYTIHLNKNDYSTGWYLIKTSCNNRFFTEKLLLAK